MLWSSLLNAILGPVLRMLGYGAAAAGGLALGTQRERAKTAAATAQAQQRMQRAEESGPRTGSEAVDVLRRGGL